MPRRGDKAAAVTRGVTGAQLEQARQLARETLKNDHLAVERSARSIAGGHEYAAPVDVTPADPHGGTGLDNWEF